MQQVILSDRSNCKQISNNIKLLWIKDILEQTGLNVSDCFPEGEDKEQTIEQKAVLRKLLKDNEISIIEEDESCVIYIQKEVIGKFEKPQYILKKDLSILDKNKQLYVEIHLEYSSVFDGND